jgi:hypothetical protein
MHRLLPFAETISFANNQISDKVGYDLSKPTTAAKSRPVTRGLQPLFPLPQGNTASTNILSQTLEILRGGDGPSRPGTEEKKSTSARSKHHSSNVESHEPEDANLKSDSQEGAKSQAENEPSSSCKQTPTTLKQRQHTSSSPAKQLKSQLKVRVSSAFERIPLAPVMHPHGLVPPITSIPNGSVQLHMRRALIGGRLKPPKSSQSHPQQPNTPDQQQEGVSVIQLEQELDLNTLTYLLEESKVNSLMEKFKAETPMTPSGCSSSKQNPDFRVDGSNFNTGKQLDEYMAGAKRIDISRAGRGGTPIIKPYSDKDDDYINGSFDDMEDWFSHSGTGGSVANGDDVSLLPFKSIEKLTLFLRIFQTFHMMLN